MALYAMCAAVADFMSNDYIAVCTMSYMQCSTTYSYYLVLVCDSTR